VAGRAVSVAAHGWTISRAEQMVGCGHVDARGGDEASEKRVFFTGTRVLANLNVALESAGKLTPT